MLPYSAAVRLLERLGRDREALGERLALAAAVDHVQRDPGRPSSRRRCSARPRGSTMHADPGTAIENAAPNTAGSGTRAPPTGIENGTRNALGRSGSRKRSAITDRCASENAIIAPNANMPARKSRSCGSASAKAISAASDDRHVGRAAAAVEPARPRSGSGGWWRASRRAAPARASGRSWPRAAAPPRRRRPRSGSRRAASPARTRTTIASTGASRKRSPSAVRVPTTGMAISAGHRHAARTGPTVARTDTITTRRSPRRPTRISPASPDAASTPMRHHAGDAEREDQVLPRSAPCRGGSSRGSSRGPSTA